MLFWCFNVANRSANNVLNGFVIENDSPPLAPQSITKTQRELQLLQLKHQIAWCFHINSTPGYYIKLINETAAQPSRQRRINGRVTACVSVRSV